MQTWHARSTNSSILVQGKVELPLDMFCVRACTHTQLVRPLAPGHEWGLSQ